MTPLTFTLPFPSHKLLDRSGGVTEAKCRLASSCAMRAPRIHTDAPAPPVNTRQVPSHRHSRSASLPLVTRDCQPRCQHTLTQPSSTPTIRPVYLRRRCGTRTALHRVSPHALDGASLGSFSAPPQHAHLSGLRPRSPESGPAKRRPQRQTQHTRAVTAGWMTERSRSPRSGPVWCVVGVHACSVAFGGFPRYPPPR